MVDWDGEGGEVGRRYISRSFNNSFSSCFHACVAAALHALTSRKASFPGGLYTNQYEVIINTEIFSSFFVELCVISSLS